MAEEHVAGSMTGGGLDAFVAQAVAALDARGVSVPAAVALLAIAVTVVFWILAKVVLGSSPGGGGKGDSVLLCGACGAGKTSLFQMLRAGSTFEGTVTSMAENQERFPVEGKLGKKVGGGVAVCTRTRVGAISRDDDPTVV